MVKYFGTDGFRGGVKSMTVDGKAVEGNVIPAFDSGEHTVEVVLG